jgi:hypothetical protein
MALFCCPRKAETVPSNLTAFTLGNCITVATTLIVADTTIVVIYCGKLIIIKAQKLNRKKKMVQKVVAKSFTKN